MLEHADADDLVEHGVARHVPIIPEFHADPILQPFFINQAQTVLVLVAAEGDAVGDYAIMHGGPTDQRAPAATDVEQAFAGFEPQLAADVIKLVALRLVQAFVASSK